MHCRSCIFATWCLPREELKIIWRAVFLDISHGIVPKCTRPLENTLTLKIFGSESEQGFYIPRFHCSVSTAHILLVLFMTVLVFPQATTFLHCQKLCKFAMNNSLLGFPPAFINSCLQARPLRFTRKFIFCWGYQDWYLVWRYQKTLMCTIAWLEFFTL